MQAAKGQGLTNVSFLAADVMEWRASEPVDLIAMFDAFHHVVAPERFLARLAGVTNRFFLIEPAGNWYGGWQQTTNLDWLAETLFLIRDRLEFQFGIVPEMRPTSPSGAAAVAGDPVERRYPLEDFYRFFEGYGLEIHGTAAGIESYGSTPAIKGDLRRDFGDLTYDLFVRVDAVLRKHDLDLHAKHWSIYAERGRAVMGRQVPKARLGLSGGAQMQGPYDAAYTLVSAPAVVKPGTRFSVVVEVENRSWRPWQSDGDSPIFLSAHVSDRKKNIVIADGPRTPWPRTVGSRECCRVNLAVDAPDRPGRYILHVDGVHEGVTWFSQVGVPTLQVPFAVRR
jgi:hypothetical protein